MGKDSKKKKLSPEQKDILLGCGTEAAFSGKYVHWKKNGDFVCAACDNVLFSSKDKFDSSTGWPSFSDVSSSTSIKTKNDYKLLVPYIEVLCQRCGGHLGHVFDDGPKESTGLRYCINSLALDFKEKKTIQKKG